MIPQSSWLLTMFPEILLYFRIWIYLTWLASRNYLLILRGLLPTLHSIAFESWSSHLHASHSLFAVDRHGLSFRPTIGDLVRRGVMRGTGIERKWRMGLYFYSTLSVNQYETGLRLQRKYTSIVISSQLSRRSSGNRMLETLHQSHVLPDIESSSLSISRSLLPVMRQLKWSIQRDKLAQLVREGLSGAVGRKNTDGAQGSIAAWFESRGRGIVQDGERVRLALCPSVRKMVHFYEQLGR